ncbi:HNH endonuclease [Cohnella nanjingensis]|uniref:HNH endonuclease n=1 Tax=Cohnella nanjingensis TaxID=1387779 RepID=A0A7X0VHF9_9BACL|nr:HNH endonuclease [Cohnella nanjingensis]MBB6672594.1 HNH endonuclease [Cohnella nanjingensis]
MKNKYEIHGDVAVIFLKRKDGTVMEALVDSADIELLNTYKGTWHAHCDLKNNGCYARGCIFKGKIKSTISMHRFLMNQPTGFMIDHINHNGLDNRRSVNLRIVSNSENQLNRKGVTRHSKSGLRNVYWNNTRSRWQAAIKKSGKVYYFGFYDDIHEASVAAENGRRSLIDF